MEKFSDCRSRGKPLIICTVILQVVNIKIYYGIISLNQDEQKSVYASYFHSVSRRDDLINKSVDYTDFIRMALFDSLFLTVSEF